MQDSKVSLSFVIPVYNSEKYIGKCIDSILEFHSDKFEIILVDDGSMDSSGSICDQYSEKNKNVKVFHKENGGVASARNTGIKESLGKYIFFVDNDDWVSADKLQRVIEILSETDVDIFINKYLIVGDDDRESVGNAVVNSNSVNKKAPNEVLDYFVKNRINIMAPWEYIIKKEIITKNNLYFNTDQNGVDDSCFSPILFCHCKSFYMSDDVVYNWSHRKDSQGKKHDKHDYAHKMLSTINILEKYLETTSEKSKQNYILFSIYKNIYSLFGQYYSYKSDDRLFLDTWYYGHKDLIRKSAGKSGSIHSLLNIIFGSFWGIILSHKLAVFKGFIYSYIYGHSRRTKE